jgi:hypothetical protein
MYKTAAEYLKLKKKENYIYGTDYNSDYNVSSINNRRKVYPNIMQSIDDSHNPIQHSLIESNYETQMPTQQSTQMSTQQSTQMSTQMPTQQSTQQSTQMSTQMPTQQSTQMPTQQSNYATQMPSNQNIKYLSDPKVWGPKLWFILHTSAMHYPKNASDRVKEQMKNRIIALPLEIPCEVCKPHAQAFIQLNYNNLDKITSGRRNLFEFYVDFHNKVNKRYNKPIISYEEAYKFWGGEGNYFFEKF